MKDLGRWMVLSVLIVGMVGGVSAEIAELRDTTDGSFRSDSGNYTFTVFRPSKDIILHRANVVSALEDGGGQGGQTFYLTNCVSSSVVATASGAPDWVDFGDVSLKANTEYGISVSNGYGYPDGDDSVPYTDKEIKFLWRNYDTGSSTGCDPSSGYQGNFPQYFELDYSLPDNSTQFNSTDVSPDPPLIGESVSYSAEPDDPDGDNSQLSTELTVFKDGSQVFQDTQAGTPVSWTDVYTPDSPGWLNATLNTTNAQGETTSTEINRLLSKKWNFTTCGASGRTGPSQTQCNNAYQGTSLGGQVDVVGEGIQEWTVPEDGTYRIEAAGAASGVNEISNWRGRGAVMRGDFTLDSGDKLVILVGQKGQGINNGASSGYGAAGGGGTFVTIGNDYTTSDPLIIGGGGGGPNNEQSSRLSAADASTSTIAKDSTSESGNLAGGTNGGAGVSGSDKYAGNGGSGFIEAANRPGSRTGYPGDSFRSGGLGGHNRYQDDSDNSRPKGGFGAGSAGDVDGAGGGGYTGGGGVENTPWIGGSAGGGGSFLHSSASDPATSDGDWGTTGSEPHKVYSGSISDLSK